jgi:quercetin dioxygenase-like cupin family protein
VLVVEQLITNRRQAVAGSDGVVFKMSDTPMSEMPNGKFRDSWMITDRTGTGKQLSAGLVWFAANNREGHPDTHAFDEVFYVIKGRARFVGDGVSHDVEAGDVVYCPAGMEHTYLTDDSPLMIFWCITEGWEKMGADLKAEIAAWTSVDPTTGWHTEF